MSEVSVSSLDARHQRLVENAKRALEQRDFDYAIQGFANVLKVAPGCLLVRRVQRLAQLEKFKTRSAIGRVLQSGRALVKSVLCFRHRTAAESLAQAGHILHLNPRNVSALRLLAESARALGMLETALFAFEAIQEILPRHRGNLLAMGAAYLELNKPAEALGIADALLISDPVDFEAQILQRKGSVAQTITSGNWAAASPFTGRAKTP